MGTITRYISLDETDEYLAEGWAVSRFSGHHARFALAIKEETLSGHKVLGVAGRKSSGKSTAAAGMPDGWLGLGFADALKAMLLGGGILTAREAYGDEKETPLDWLDGVTPRHVMQTLGCEWGRSLHPDFWVRLWRRKAEYSLAAGHGVVAADVRFPNEIAAIRELGGVVVWIERPGLAAKDGHVSENAIGPADCDFAVRNDGDEDALRRRVWSVVGS